MFACVSLLSALVGVRAPIPGATDDPRVLDPRVVAFFERTLEDSAAATADLAVLFARDPDPLLDALITLQPGGPAPFEAQLPGGEGAEPILLATLERISARDLVKLVDARVAQPLELSELFAMSKALQRCAAAADVPRATALAVAAGSRLGDEQLQDAFEAALTAVLAQGPSEIHLLRRSWDQLPAEALAPSVRAVAACGDPAGLDFAVHRLTFDAELVPELLTAIGTLGARAETRARLDAAEAVLGYVWRCRSPAETQGVVDCLGRLGDDRAAPELVPLLESDDSGVRRTTWRTLCRLTGLAYPPERACWEAWCSEEERWFSDRAPELFADLESPRLAEVVAAIQEIGAHRLHREELVEQLIVPLSDERDVVRIHACIAHQRLARRSSLPHLEELSGDPSPDVRSAAEAAIRAIER